MKPDAPLIKVSGDVCYLPDSLKICDATPVTNEYDATVVGLLSRNSAMAPSLIQLFEPAWVFTWRSAPVCTVTSDTISVFIILKVLVAKMLKARAKVSIKDNFEFRFLCPSRFFWSNEDRCISLLQQIFSDRNLRIDSTMGKKIIARKVIPSMIIISSMSKMRKNNPKFLFRKAYGTK